jgi:hypothetical protein
MPILDHVDLSGCRISDQALEILAQKVVLTFVNVSNTNVTPSGVTAFRESRPDVQIVASHLR